MLNQYEMISRLRGELQDIYKRLAAAHRDSQIIQSPITRADIVALAKEMDAIVDELIRLEGES